MRSQVVTLNENRDRERDDLRVMLRQGEGLGVRGYFRVSLHEPYSPPTTKISPLSLGEGPGVRGYFRVSD